MGRLDEGRTWPTSATRTTRESITQVQTALERPEAID